MTVHATGENADGSKIATNYTAQLDGKDYPVSGGTGYEMVTLKVLDDHTMHAERKHDGKVVQTVHSVLAKDGKSYTSTTTGTVTQDGYSIASGDARIVKTS